MHENKVKMQKNEKGFDFLNQVCTRLPLNKVVIGYCNCFWLENKFPTNFRGSYWHSLLLQTSY